MYTLFTISGYYEGLLIEENTLTANLCDLLERILSHGLQAKKVTEIKFDTLSTISDYRKG